MNTHNRGSAARWSHTNCKLWTESGRPGTSGSAYDERSNHPMAAAVPTPATAMCQTTYGHVLDGRSLHGVYSGY